MTCGMKNLRWGLALGRKRQRVWVPPKKDNRDFGEYGATPTKNPRLSLGGSAERQGHSAATQDQPNRRADRLDGEDGGGSRGGRFFRADRLDGGGGSRGGRFFRADRLDGGGGSRGGSFFSRSVHLFECCPPSVLFTSMSIGINSSERPAFESGPVLEPLDWYY